MMEFISFLIFIKTRKNRFSQMITDKEDSKSFSQMVRNKNNAYK